MNTKLALIKHLPRVSCFSAEGNVIEVTGTKILASLDGVVVGDLVEIKRDSHTPLMAEVTGFSVAGVNLTPYCKTSGIKPGAKVSSLPFNSVRESGNNLLGKVTNALGVEGEELASCSPIHLNDSIPLLADTIAPKDHFLTGIAAIDIFTPLAYGQRVGIYAEPGVGKSTLLQEINEHSKSDISVVALIGERRREVVEFVESMRKRNSSNRTVVIQATSDLPAIVKIKAAETAFRIAEHFRDSGKNVLLTLDSATRLFRAYREVGLSCGEMPVRKGYPPSAFARLPRLVERAGATNLGTITALFTVLLSDDIEQDPMVEELKSLTDGHIILSSRIAKQNIFPAIDIIQSLSRLERKISSPEDYNLSAEIKRVIAQERNESDISALRGVITNEEEARRNFVRKVIEILQQTKCSEDTLRSLKSELLALLNELNNYAANLSSTARCSSERNDCAPTSKRIVLGQRSR